MCVKTLSVKGSENVSERHVPETRETVGSPAVCKSSHDSLKNVSVW